MAPGTHVGAATPVGLDGGDLSRKIAQDAEANARSLAQTYGRNEDVAAAFVSEGRSITAEEALDQNIIEYVEPSAESLLASVDGTTVHLSNGTSVTLATAGVPVEMVDVGGFVGFRRAASRLARGNQHLEHPLLHAVPHLHVLPRQLRHRVHRRRRVRQHLRDLLLDVFLLPHEGGDALFQVAGHEVLHRPAVVADDRLEELGRQDGLAELLLLGDHLQEDQARDVLARLVLDHADLLAPHDQVADVLERDVLADGGVIEPPVGVLLDQPFLGHGQSLPDRAAARYRAAAST